MSPEADASSEDREEIQFDTVAKEGARVDLRVRYDREAVPRELVIEELSVNKDPRRRKLATKAVSGLKTISQRDHAALVVMPGALAQHGPAFYAQHGLVAQADGSMRLEFAGIAAERRPAESDHAVAVPQAEQTAAGPPTTPAVAVEPAQAPVLKSLSPLERLTAGREEREARWIGLRAASWGAVTARESDEALKTRLERIGERLECAPSREKVVADWSQSGKSSAVLAREDELSKRASKATDNPDIEMAARHQLLLGKDVAAERIAEAKKIRASVRGRTDDQLRWQLGRLYRDVDPLDSHADELTAEQAAVEEEIGRRTLERAIIANTEANGRAGLQREPRLPSEQALRARFSQHFGPGGRGIVDAHVNAIKARMRAPNGIGAPVLDDHSLSVLRERLGNEVDRVDWRGSDGNGGRSMQLVSYCLATQSVLEERLQRDRKQDRSTGEEKSRAGTPERRRALETGAEAAME
jgi:hypothetical protein